MRADCECPYCAAMQEICHDDGYGYEEDGIYQQECSDCGKKFAYTTRIHFYYEVAKADCLNGAEHKWKQTITVPREFTRMRCTDCGEERKPTEEEISLQ